jgi:cysteine synthase A
MRPGAAISINSPFAERAVDWRSDNIADSIFSQMAAEEHRVPTWLVCGAGTGGTSATIGRYVRHRGLSTMLCLADPLESVYHRHMVDPRIRIWPNRRSLIEGIGRPQVEASFVPELHRPDDCCAGCREHRRCPRHV